MIQIELWQSHEFISRTMLPAKPLRLGRCQHCDIQLPDPTLSREHLVIRPENDRLQIENLSTNGIYHDAKRMPDRFFANVDYRYRIGRIYEFRLRYKKQKKKAVDREPKTLMISNRPTQLISLSTDKQQIVWTRGILKMRSADDKEHRVLIPAEGLSIGRHSQNDCVLEGNWISQFHARIDLTPKHYVLTDLGSTNGTFLDGSKILQAPLNGNAEIRLGKTELFFFLESQTKPLKPKKTENFLGLVSKDREMKKLFAYIEAAAPSEAPIYLHGESGTGKELAAKALHQLSHRCEGPFLTLNCSALPEDLVESELFGHEKGSFSGAVQNRQGALEAAHGGTLFLDEVGELPLQLQAKLLRAVESGEFKRIGSNHAQHASVRIISASHKELYEEVKNKTFREDLYYRLVSMRLYLPALRERSDDLEVLIPHLIEQMNLNCELSEEAIAMMKNYAFPGNVRELKNILQRAVIEFQIKQNSPRSSKIKKIQTQHLQFLKEVKRHRLPRTTKEESEREVLLQYLERNYFNQSQTARELQIPISTLHDRMKRLGIQKPKFKSQAA